MRGFILLARAIQENSVWHRDPDHLKLFLYLLMNANYRKDKVYELRDFKGNIVSVGYGQYLCSYSRISDDCQYSAGNKLVRWVPSKVMRMLKALEEDGRIKVVGRSQLGSLVEVVNYQVYQDVSTYSHKELGRPAKDQRKQSKQLNTVKAEVKELWSVYLDELGGKGKQPSLTAKRRQVLSLLYEEQLEGTEDYRESFRSILKAVKDNEFFKKREYQMPESLFRNEERRERWAMKGAEKRHKPKAHTVSRNQWSVDA